MNRQHQVANAIGYAALEMAVMALGVLAFSRVNPTETAIVVVMTALATGGLFLAYGLYCRHIGRDDGRYAFAAMIICLMVGASWLPAAV